MVHRPARRVRWGLRRSNKPVLFCCNGHFWSTNQDQSKSQIHIKREEKGILVGFSKRPLSLELIPAASQFERGILFWVFAREKRVRGEVFKIWVLNPGKRSRVRRRYAVSWILISYAVFVARAHRYLCVCTNECLYHSTKIKFNTAVSPTFRQIALHLFWQIGYIARQVHV